MQLRRRIGMKRYLSPRRQDAKKSSEISDLRNPGFRILDFTIPKFFLASWRLGVLARDISFLFFSFRSQHCACPLKG
jgi:hypothetical protein